MMQKKEEVVIVSKEGKEQKKHKDKKETNNQSVLCNIIKQLSWRTIIVTLSIKKRIKVIDHKTKGIRSWRRSLVSFLYCYLKENPKGVSMCRIMEDMRNESVKEGIQEEKDDRNPNVKGGEIFVWGNCEYIRAFS